MSQAYGLKNVIACGTYSSVFEGVDNSKRLTLTIKCIDLDCCDTQIFKQQIEEIRRNRLLDNDFIIKYKEVFVEGHKLWVTMPYTLYGSCLDIIKCSGNVFEEDLIYRVLMSLLPALNYLHCQRIVHRAVQASHLLMTDMGRVLLTGIKHCVSLPPNTSSHEYPEGLEKRLPWAAPELLCQGRRGYDTTADIYSVGITVLELLNGAPPYQGLPPTKIYLMKLSGDSNLPFLSGNGVPHISKRLVRMIDKCVQHNPAYRPSVGSLIKSSFFKSMKRRAEPAADILYNKEYKLSQVSRTAGVVEESTASSTPYTDWVYD